MSPATDKPAKVPTLVKVTLSIAGAAIVIEGASDDVREQAERFYSFASEALDRQSQLAAMLSAGKPQ